MISFNDIVYFTQRELQCKCKFNDCPKINFAEGFEEQLLKYRLILGLPMNPTSVCRCKKHNDNVSNAENSYHRLDHPISKGTCGIDFRFPSIEYLVKALTVAELLGWSVGVNWRLNFIHTDRRADYGQPKQYFPY